ncbi:MAG: hypothetical protein AAF543_19425 [Pseudomonadota bacterium]
MATVSRGEDGTAALDRQVCSIIAGDQLERRVGSTDVEMSCPDQDLPIDAVRDARPEPSSVDDETGRGVRGRQHHGAVFARGQLDPALGHYNNGGPAGGNAMTVCDRLTWTQRTGTDFMLR